jgi:hypothetical protein
MTVFGKKLSEYVAFEKAGLTLIAIVGFLRLVLSLAGVADATTRWLSMTAVSLPIIIYYGVVTHTKGFGSYRQLLPLYALQAIVVNTIVIAGILISAATGKATIFTAPEHGGNQPLLLQIGGRVLGGLIIAPLVIWLIGSIAMFVTKKVKPGPTRAAAATA